MGAHPTEVIAGPLGEMRSASASGGTSLSTTPVFVPLPSGTKILSLWAHTFSTAVAAQFSLNPYLIVLVTDDALATAPTDASENAQDGSTATSVTLSSLPTAANGGFVYVGSHLPFRGVNVDVDDANGTASVLTVRYWDGSSWEDISDTDGTASGGATFAQDGNVTWTIPADWAKTSLVAAGDTALTTDHLATPLYWTRWEVSAALDTPVTLDSMSAMNRSTAYWQIPEDYLKEVAVTRGPGGVGVVEARTNAGTATLVVNVATTSSGSFV